METQIQIYLRQRLIKYLNSYIKKEFRMDWVFRELKKSLKSGERITEKQLWRIMSFLQREREFRGDTTDQIVQYFSPIMNRKKDKVSSRDVEQLNVFFVGLISLLFKIPAGKRSKSISLKLSWGPILGKSS